MQKLQRGFTLIELVVVVVVLGILSAVAVPRYIDYKEGAGAAAVKGVAAALAAAAATNYAARVAGIANAANVTRCADIPALLTGGIPSTYRIIDSGAVPTAAIVVPVSAASAASNSNANPGTITAATMGNCLVSSSDFTATANFPYTPFGVAAVAATPPATLPVTDVPPTAP